MWKDIKNWEDYYEVNEYGDVRNKRTKKLLKGDKNSIGYPRVCLYCKDHNPQKERFFRHRLVAEHFIPNNNNYPEVNHIDLDITNCFVGNLEWVTRYDNEIHSKLFGNKSYKPLIVIWEDGLKEFIDSASDLAKKLNVNRRTVKLWALKSNCGYKKYKIKSISYF